MTRWLVGAASLLVGLGAYYLVGAYALMGTCAVSDTADRKPAPASAQGMVCEALGGTNADEGPWLWVAALVLVVSLALAVLLAVRSWTVPRWRVLGLTACLWLPLLVFVAFGAPSDSCTDEQQQELSAYSCARTTET